MKIKMDGAHICSLFFKMDGAHICSLFLKMDGAHICSLFFILKIWLDLGPDLLVQSRFGAAR